MIAKNSDKSVEYNGKTPLKGKRERFAQIMSTNKYNQTEAHKEAGYRSWNGCKRYAHELATNPIIKARIGYLQTKLAEKLEITREKQASQYIEAADRFKAEGDNTNYIKALNSIDKLFGLAIDKLQTDQTGAQTARTAAERLLDEEYAEFLLDRAAKKRREELKLHKEA